MEIEFTVHVFKNGRMYIAYSPELDLSSCATTQKKAQENLKEAVRLFIEEAEKNGSLQHVLEESGFVRRRRKLEGPRLVTTRLMTMPLEAMHAKD